MKKRIGISLGDVTGVGPEITVKALSALEKRISASYLILGDFGYLDHWNRRLGSPLQLSQDQPEGRYLVQPGSVTELPQTLPTGCATAAQAALEWLREGARRCLEGELAALVTAPVSKEAIIRSGQVFIGQTEFLSGLAQTERTAMMLMGSDEQGHTLRVILATTHLPIREVADALTTVKVELAIELAAACCRDLGLKSARIGVCGLNPHAGEGGLLGKEEQTVIQPAIQRCREKGYDVTDPIAADALFYHAFQGDYDAVVAMYHDQGLAPLKMIGFDRGINWTLGLPFIRISPDHGTAYNIAGKGIAKSSSMEAALLLADQLAAAIAK